MKEDQPGFLLGIPVYQYPSEAGIDIHPLEIRARIRVRKGMIARNDPRIMEEILRLLAQSPEFTRRVQFRRLPSEDAMDDRYDDLGARVFVMQNFDEFLHYSAERITIKPDPRPFVPWTRWAVFVAFVRVLFGMKINSE